MSRRRKANDTTPFDTLRLEGTLFVPELLERASRGDAPSQQSTDYAIPKGLKLHDEYGRAFRIASALWQDFAIQIPRNDVDKVVTTRAFAIEFLQQCLGYADLAAISEPKFFGDRGFPVTAQAIGGRIPVIVAPHNLGLDDPAPRFAIIGSGAKKKSAHQLAQEYLNASHDALWAIVTNGRTLRLLRDAETLTRPNFLEFDLETILREGEARYADFSALWRILHVSRAGTSSAPANECVWESWKSEGHAQGLRVRDGLRDGVTNALLILGSGFVSNQENNVLRERLHDGSLTKEAYFQQLLRLIYRCLFLFCAEERDLLHAPDSSVTARQTYTTGYSLRRLRQRSLRQSAHDSYGDLWISTKIVFRALASGQDKLALPALGGLFAKAQCPDIDDVSLANRDLLAAMRELRWFADPKTKKRSAIDYRNMGPEELGSVYESLLELIPTIDLPTREFGFVGITNAGSTSGNTRKTTGSYYTPDSLVQELIKSALDPVIADRLKENQERPVEALLAITVCDPSCGSGHFLLAAARRLAEKLAELRAPDGAIRPDDYRHALREVASRCLYGVDINPMAVELCRVALWLETVDPGKPLGFLNHHIRHGNSLLGTTPDLIAAGLPDETFTAIEGDDKPACAELKKRNKAERTGFGPLFAKDEDSIREKLRQAASSIEAMDDSQPDALQKKEAAFLTNETAPEYRHAKLLADLWCAAFVIKKTYPTEPDDSQISNPESPIPSPIEGQLLHTDDDLFGQSVPAAKPTAKPKKSTDHRPLGTAVGITTGTLRNYVQGKPLSEDLESEVNQLDSQYRFFHWHLAFPQVFDQGGFDCILGNPPWDRVKFNDQDWFGERMPEIANAPTTAARKKLIDGLSDSSPHLLQEFEAARREFEGLNSFIRTCGHFPNGSSGELNLATLFAEHAATIVGPKGQAGLVLPTTVVTDKSAQPLCRSWIENGRLVAVYDFENRAGLFPGVHRSYKFAIITLRGSGEPGAHIKTAFYLQDPTELTSPENLLIISVDDIALVNPNTLGFPVSRTAADAQLLLAFHRRAEPLLRDGDSASGGSWGYSVFFVFEMNKDSGKFSTSSSAFSLPLLEAKLIHQFEHRAATFDGQAPRDITSGNARETTAQELADPNFGVKPRYWVPAADVANSFKRGGITNKWAVVAREITNATNERTVLTCIIPKVGMGHTCWTLRLSKADAALAGIFSASLNSFAHDYAARQKVSGTHLSNFIIKQLPVLPPDTYARPGRWATHPPSLRDWLLPRVLELTYTAWDLQPFAQDCGWPGPPFRRDENRRFLLRCELDAAFFHLYLGNEDEWQKQPEALTRAFPKPRDAVSYIMDTFPIVKRKDEAKHGSYRTKDTILEIYDALTVSIQTGIAYKDRLPISPADIRITHHPRWPDDVRLLPDASDYFMWIIPLILRLQSDGIEAKHLIHVLDILTNKKLRTSLVSADEFQSRWAESMAKLSYSFSDATGALLAWRAAGNLQGTHLIKLAPGAAVPVEDPWLELDAFMALKIAMTSAPEVVEETATKQRSIIEELQRLTA